MARPVKKGVEYFPMDVSLYRDPKIKRLRSACGSVGMDVYLYLLTLIYENGYCMEWDEGSAFDISYDLNLDEHDVQQVVDACFRLGLFSQTQCAVNGILTSAGIQERWERIAKDSKRAEKEVEPPHRVNSEETRVSPVKTPVSSGRNSRITEETPEKREESTQRKGKEKKVKESTEVGVEIGGVGERGATVADAPATDSLDKQVVKVEKPKHPMLDWIAANTPRLAQMKEPLTPEQADSLLAKFKPDQIAETFAAMHNWEPLVKKNRSTYLTALKWIKTEMERKREKASRNTNKLTNGHAYERLYAEQREQAFSVTAGAH